jgi:hypothetical protein
MADSLFLRQFTNRIQSEGKYFAIEPSCFCPVVRLPQTQDEFFERLSAGRRRKFKKEFGILNQGNDVKHEVIKEDRLQEGLGEFLCFYEENGRGSTTVRPVLQKFLDKYHCNHCNNPMQIDLLTVKGQTAGSLLHFTFQGSTCLYLWAVDKKFNPKISLGDILLGLRIRKSIEKGCFSVDFLKGDEAYKFHWTGEGRSCIRLSFWQKRPVAIASALGRLARHAAKLILR